MRHVVRESQNWNPRFSGEASCLELRLTLQNLHAGRHSGTYISGNCTSTIGAILDQ